MNVPVTLGSLLLHRKMQDLIMTKILGAFHFTGISMGIILTLLSKCRFCRLVEQYDMRLRKC
jgi:hypothetical protein